jgi:drug/metabolite transporter (DMT)-like permease
MLALLALLAAIGYGAANFAGGVASRRQHATATLFYSQSVALFIILPIVFLSGGQPGSIRLGMAAGVVAFCGAALAYTCFSLGRPIGVAAALLGIASAAVPVTVGLATSQQPGLLGIAGLFVGLAAIIVLAWPREEKTDLQVALLATGAGAAFGAYHSIMAHTAHSSGWWPLIASQWVIVSLSLLSMLVMRARPGDRTAISLSFTDGGTATLATFAALAAVRGGALPVVGTLIALSPAATLLLARLFLAERLTLQKIMGLALAGGAVILLTLPA